MIEMLVTFASLVSMEPFPLEVPINKFQAPENLRAPKVKPSGARSLAAGIRLAFQ